MLRWRLTLGTIFIAALVGLVYLDVQAAADTRLPPGLFLLPLALTICVAATNEFVRFVQEREPSVQGHVIGVGNWLIVASPWLGASIGGAEGIGRWHMLAVAAAVLLVFLSEIMRYDKDKSTRVTERIALSVLGLAYIGLLLSFLIRLRLSPAGIFPLVLMLVVVKMADIGAYTVGRLIGKHTMAPKLSPGKTWEGFVGGLAFSVLGAVALGYFTDMDLRTPLGGGYHDFKMFIPFALVVGAVGSVGDLAESLLKRDFGKKDSSEWMPGFGGVLDLIDSPLFAAPVAWAFWELGWIAL
jgi:phosphatidate cytidylyltransferase